jgi:hypothetical protein
MLALTENFRSGILALMSMLKGERVDAPIFAGTGASTLTIGSKMVTQGCRWLSERRRPGALIAGTGAASALTTGRMCSECLWLRQE